MSFQNNLNTNNKKMKAVAKHYVVRKQDLPLSCPMKDKEGWSYHPKVYLPVQEAGEINCPYCGTKYVMEASS
jgi:uncharacterized Zn-finger protein